MFDETISDDVTLRYVTSDTFHFTVMVNDPENDLDPMGTLICETVILGRLTFRFYRPVARVFNL